MALPPTFSNRVRLQAGRVADRYAAPSVLGQVASVVGRTMGQIGEQDAEAERQIAASQQRVREREIARDREVQDVELTEKFVNLQMDRTKQARDLEENYTSGQDMAGAVTKLYQDSDSAFLDQIGDQELRGKYQVMLARDRAEAMDRADLFVRKKRIERETNATIGITTALGNKLVTLGPEGSIKDFDDAEATVKGVITADRFKDRAELIQRDVLGKLADNWLDGRIVAGDYKGAAEAITSGRFKDFLDPATAATAMAKIQQRTASAAAAQVSDFKATARTALEDVNAGVAVDPQQLETMAAQAEAAGESDLAHDLRNGVGLARTNSVYGNAAPAEIIAARRQIEQSGSDWRSNPQVVAVYNRLGVLERQNGARVKDDVLGLWSASGQPVAPLDISDGTSIRARYKDARAAQQRYGGQLQVMSALEIEPLRQQFEQGGAADKAAIINNFTSAGADVGKAFMRQIAPAKPEYAWLTDLAAMRNVSVGRGYVREALAGWEHLKNDGTPVQGENATKMRQAFDRTIGPAMRGADGNSRLAVMRTAQGIYAARAVQAGAKDFDKDLWGQAMQDALGAASDGTGGMGRTRGDAPMLLPRGMSQRDVDTVIARADGPRIVAAAGGNMPMWGGRRLLVGQLQDMQMEWAGDGLYRFRSPGGQYVSASKAPAMPFVLDIRRLALSGRNAAVAAPQAPAPGNDARSAAESALATGSLMEGLFGIKPAPAAPKKVPALKGKGSQAAQDALSWGSDD